MAKNREVLLDPLINTNPIAVQVLGVCSALAVTGKLETAVVMSIALTAGNYTRPRSTHLRVYRVGE